MFQRDRIVLMLAGVVTAAFIYVYPLVLPTPLLEPDEGLHATISQEMLEHDEWVAPRFRGELFADKPILYFWVQMLSLRTFGMNEFAVRLPGLMFGLLGSLTTGLLAQRLFGSQTGVLALLMSMTMFIPLSLAQSAAHDVALVPWVNLALLCLWETERSPLRRTRVCWWCGAACWLALAVLTKALLGMAIIGIAFVAFLAVSRRLAVGSCARFTAAVALGAAIASPWFIAMELRSSGYLYYYFIERHLLGFATATQPHGREPWYYYFPFVTLGAMPWSWYLAPLLFDEWKNRTKENLTAPSIVLLLCWLLGGLLFLSIAGSKLVTYALPLFPAIAILSAVAWERFAGSKLSGASDQSFVMMTRLVGVAGAAVPFGALLLCGFLTDTSWPPICWLCAAAVAGISITAGRVFEGGWCVGAVALSSLWVAGFTALLMTWPLQTFAEDFSEKPLAEWINRRDVLPRHLILIGEKPASVIFYLKNELRRQLAADQFSCLPIKELPSDSKLADGVVLAVTEESLRQANIEQLQIPGAVPDSSGQFLIFESDPGFFPLVETAWRSR